MDYFLYWFMLPVSTLVATAGVLGGIGGAAMFVPIFLIVFPLLGPEYALETFPNYNQIILASKK